MSVNRPDYQASYVRFRAFIECAGRRATHCIGKSDISSMTLGSPCYTREGVNLSLCADCLHFWQECIEHGDMTTWQIAVYLRELRNRDPGESKS